MNTLHQLKQQQKLNQKNFPYNQRSKTSSFQNDSAGILQQQKREPLMEYMEQRFQHDQPRYVANQKIKIFMQ